MNDLTKAALLALLALGAILVLLNLPIGCKNIDAPAAPPSGFGISSCGSGIDEGTGGVK